MWTALGLVYFLSYFKKRGLISDFRSVQFLLFLPRSLYAFGPNYQDLKKYKKLRR